MAASSSFITPGCALAKWGTQNVPTLLAMLGGGTACAYLALRLYPCVGYGLLGLVLRLLVGASLGVALLLAAVGPMSHSL